MLFELFFPSGIVSSISFSPQNGMLAVGSYSQTTAVYAESNMEPLYVLHGQLGGVTQVSETTVTCLPLPVWMADNNDENLRCFSRKMGIIYIQEGGR
jgi:hypothetical protein